MLQAALRGCVGAAIYSVGLAAEVVFVFHLARVGQQCVGCHIGPAGRYTAMSPAEMKKVKRTAAVIPMESPYCSCKLTAPSLSKLLEPAILTDTTQITSSVTKTPAALP